MTTTPSSTNLLWSLFQLLGSNPAELSKSPEDLKSGGPREETCCIYFPLNCKYFLIWINDSLLLHFFCPLRLSNNVAYHIHTPSFDSVTLRSRMPPGNFRPPHHGSTAEPPDTISSEQRTAQRHSRRRQRCTVGEHEWECWIHHGIKQF